MFAKAFYVAAVYGLLASFVNAHMEITSPVPYGQDTLNNSPLEPDGSDFPCKQRSGVYDITSMNNIAVGVPQALIFKGGATHGGGSCQLSVTMDKEPTKNSVWKVVYSIIGGCPNSAAGNADGSPDYDQNPTFQWSMPRGMPNGQYTLAWTWFNKIGNREMYMNCAPITVTGGADNDDVLNSLPDMFVANIENGQCETAEMQDFVFPNPGKYVVTAESTALGSSTIGTCPTGSAGDSGSGSSPDASSAVATTAAAPTGGSASIGGVSSPVAAGFTGAVPSATEAGSGSGPVTLTTMATVTAIGPSPTPDAQGSGSAPEPGSSNGTSSGSCSGESVSCPTPGSVVCIGSNKWGLCDINYCAVPMALSDGTSCSGGVIAKRAAHLAHLKRRHVHHGASV